MHNPNLNLTQIHTKALILSRKSEILPNVCHIGTSHYYWSQKRKMYINN